MIRWRDVVCGISQIRRKPLKDSISKSKGKVSHLGFYLCRIFFLHSIGSDRNRAWISISLSWTTQEQNVMRVMWLILFSSNRYWILRCVWTRYRRLHFPVGSLDHINQRWTSRSWISPPTFVTCNSPWKRPIFYTGWPPNLMNWGCPVLSVNCSLLNVHYVYSSMLDIILFILRIFCLGNKRVCLRRFHLKSQYKQN